MILPNNWRTKQVDYTNVFSCEYFKEEVYIYPPCGFWGSDGITKVLRLIKSIYGILRLPKKFFDKFQYGLLEWVFIQSTLDPCLFIKYNMIFLVYVYDKIFSVTNKQAIES